MAPRVRSDLVLVHDAKADFSRAFVVHDRATNRYWRTGPLQYEMVQLFATLDWDAACAQLRERFEEPIEDSEIQTAYAELATLGLLELTQETVDQAHLTPRTYRSALHRLGLRERRRRGLHADVRAFIDSARTTPPEALLETARALEGVEPRLMAAFYLAIHLGHIAQEDDKQPALLRWMRLQVPLFNPDAQLDRWLPRLGFLFRPWFVVLTALTSLVGFAIYVERAREIHQRLSYVSGNLVLLFSCTAFILLVHEYAHAITCKHFGGGVREMGLIVFLFFLPAAYCDVSDAHLFSGRRAKLWVTLAGIWSTFVLASLGALLWSRTVPTSLLSQMGLVLMVSGYGTVLTNLNPLLPLDGYFALGDWLQVDNLRDRAPDYCREYLWARITGKPVPAATPRERRIFFAYFLVGTTYQISYLFISLAIGWLMLVRGGTAIGLLLFVVLLWLFYLRNYWLRMQALWRQSRTKQLFAWLGGAVVVLAVLAVWRTPVSLTLPVVVRESGAGYVLEGELPEKFVEAVRSARVARATVVGRWSVPVEDVAVRLRSHDGRTAPFASARIDPSTDRAHLGEGLNARMTVTSNLTTSLWRRLWGEQWDRVILDVWRLL